MTQMTTLGEVWNKVDALGQNCYDRYVPVPEISFKNIETMNIGSRQFSIKPMAQRSVANRLGVPYHYLRKCSDDLQQMNLNYWIEKEKNDQLFLRFDDQSVRALFTPKYVPVDNFEVLTKLDEQGYKPETEVQCHLDDTLMLLNIPDGNEFVLDGNDRMRPGISIVNSEVGMSSLTISAFILRLICTNGMITKDECANSYRHVSVKILNEFPEVLAGVSSKLVRQESQLRISMESKVDNPIFTMDTFNRQFQLGEDERNAVEWAWSYEAGDTMFHVVNTYTKAAQAPKLSAENSYRLQRVGGSILNMVN